MKLVIVESPTKARTILKFLSKDYNVLSSFGHVRDLPKRDMGVDIEHGFKPKYVIPTKARKAIKALKEAAAKSDEIIMATDKDREGEAIAWHLTYILKQDPKTVKRIVFHEITKSAIEDALAHPHGIDSNLVEAQQARRILDRLVGYELSPFLWKKVRYGLSAGRVQSVAVRLVVEREREIEAFNAQEYWTIEADLAKKGDDQSFRARLTKEDGKALDKLEIKDGDHAKKILDTLEGANYKVIDIQKKEVKRNPSPPFITSTLQQEAARKLGLSAKQTMMIAQKLYETGLITYMRTDSLNMAESALSQAHEVITKTFGAKYALDTPRRYKTKSKGAQEAHEAIRPTNLSKSAEDLRGGDSVNKRLYDLIWKRTLATQMAVAVFDQTAVDIEAGKYTFRANGQVVKFDGFIRVYTEGRDDGNGSDIEGQLPELSKDEELNLEKLENIQHFTEPPPRYSDATLIKALEANGIGRPSTYAPTLSTIQDRDYVEKEEKRYKPTEVGFLVNDILVEHFPEIVDMNFTSHIEEELDDIAEGKLSWSTVLKEFYQPFKKNLELKKESVEKVEEESDVKCEHCSENMMIKFGRNGKFLACPDPESKITKPLPEEQEQLDALAIQTKDEICPECKGPMKVRKGRFGYFLGCVDYPKCKGIAKIVTRIGFDCPNCGKGELIERKSRGRGKLFYGCSAYPDCSFLINEIPESKERLFDMLEEWKVKPKRKSRVVRRKK
ncbi:MAG: type I DNA topoisomerase [Parcubacteria group bacterium]